MWAFIRNGRRLWKQMTSFPTVCQQFFSTGICIKSKMEQIINCGWDAKWLWGKALKNNGVCIPHIYLFNIRDFWQWQYTQSIFCATFIWEGLFAEEICIPGKPSKKQRSDWKGNKKKKTRFIWPYLFPLATSPREKSNPCLKINSQRKKKTMTLTITTTITIT